MDFMTYSRLFRRQAGLVFLVLAGWVTPAVALFFGGDKADPAHFEAGRAQLEDGFYELARDRLQAYLDGDPDKVSRGEAVLLLAQALYGLESYDEMVRLLGEREGWVKAAEAEGAGAFWKARGLAALGRYDGALDQLRDFDGRYPGETVAPEAALLRAQVLLKAVRVDESLAAYREFADRHADGPEGPAGLLEWGAVLLAEGRAEEASTVLTDVADRFPGTEAGRRARLRLAGLLAEQGETAEAVTLLSALTDTEEADAVLRAKAWLSLADLYAGGTNLAAAAEAYASATSHAPMPHLAAEGRLGQGRTLIRMGQTDEGIELMHAAVGAMTSDTRRAEGQLDLAELLQAQGRHDLAAAEFQTYLEAFEAGEGQARALRGKAWSLWEVGDYTAASGLFERAMAAETNLDLRAELMVKAADSLFAAESYGEAATQYRAFTELYPGHALAGQARFQEAESLARSGDDAGAEALWEDLLSSAADTNLASEILLRRGILEEERGRWKEAVAWFDRVIEDYAGLPAARQALHRRGVTLYRTGRFEEALKDLEAVVALGQDTEYAEEAFYMRGWCLYMLGRDEEAVEICREFLDRFPASRWAPRVLFWMGEYYWNLGDDESAETWFVDLAVKYPESPLADEGYFWAGRSAARRKDYTGAVEHFGDLAKLHSNSPLLPEARFLQGDALTELGGVRTADAILAFEEIIRTWPDSYFVDAAWGRKGDCLFTLGTGLEDSEARTARLEEAMAAYGTVASSDSASFELKLQAGYKVGRCLEKMGRTDEAFRQYTNVVYAYTGARHLHGETDPFWFTRAAFSAAAIMKSQERWEAAITLYRRVIRERVPAADEAEKFIQEIRLKHWLPF